MLVEISDSVLQRLFEERVASEKTVEETLERLVLGNSSGKPAFNIGTKSTAGRFSDVILHVVQELGGSACTLDIRKAMLRLIGSQLSGYDRFCVTYGEGEYQDPRWWNRARLDAGLLRKAGKLSIDSFKGTWTLAG